MHFCTVEKDIRSFNRIGLKTMSKMLKITPGWLAPSFSHCIVERVAVYPCAVR
jgi:hypothetical protein